jgi:hypothetical protein
MKTAMQELIEWYKKEHFVKTTFHIQLLNKFESLLEKEKEQIIKAMSYSTYREMKGINVSNEKYYNQTYKK